jgi:tetrapyrrole methylase family protein/MazG family protein
VVTLQKKRPKELISNNVSFRWQSKKFKFKASQILKNEAYFSYAAVMRDAAQRRNWTFYEAIKLDLAKGLNYRHDFNLLDWSHYINDHRKNTMKEFDRLMDIMDTLRGPGGCPWDVEQDHKSIMKCLIEETYELADAIESGDREYLMEELGDVFLQVVFHSAIAKDNHLFTLEEVINDLCDKLIYRHPHVFSDTTVKDSKEVIKNWERLKRKEVSKKERKSILAGVPNKLPALLHALKIQSIVSRVGFDWENPEGVVDKIKEEIQEVSEAAQEKDKDRMEDEIGDLFFSVVNLARMLDIDPEAALRRTNKKFATRFYEIEKVAKDQSVRLPDMPMAEKEAIWQGAKTKI